MTWMEIIRDEYLVGRVVQASDGLAEFQGMISEAYLLTGSVLVIKLCFIRLRFSSGGRWSRIEWPKPYALTANITVMNSPKVTSQGIELDLPFFESARVLPIRTMPELV